MVREIEFAQFGSTVIHPLALAFTLAMGVALLFVRRSQALLPFALVATLIPDAQRLVVASLDFNMVRLLVLFGWARLAMRGELRPLRLNALDWSMIAWLSIGSVIYVARETSFSAVVYRLGTMFDAAGVYFLFRLLIRERRDLIEPMRSLAWICVLLACFMAVEWSTGRNYFSIFGGVSDFTLIRDGRLRCQGAFSHPIMAGSFGASLAPIFFGLWLVYPRLRRPAAAGTIAAIFIAITTASSGPVISLLTAFLGWGLWLVRPYTRLLRWGTLVLLTIVHFAREKPVWHLIGRLGDLVGGTGYHRYHLIDAFVRHFGDWWLIGVSSTANWGWGLQDLTNQYVYEGVLGGVLGLVAFVTLLSLAFRTIGRARRNARRAPQPIRSQDEIMAWALGVSLATHCVSFISVTYFGQMQVIFYLVLALIASFETAVGPSRHRAARTRPAPDRDSAVSAISQTARAGGYARSSAFRRRTAQGHA